MHAVRLTVRWLGAILLRSALMCSVLVSSAAGEALVLHHHGRRAHLHVLGPGDLRANAAWSARFAHARPSGPAAESGSERVRVFVLVATDSNFVPTPRGTDLAEAQSASFQVWSPFFVAEPQVLPSVDVFSTLSAAWSGLSTSALLLLRNHTLLI